MSFALAGSNSKNDFFVSRNIPAITSFVTFTLHVSFSSLSFCTFFCRNLHTEMPRQQMCSVIFVYMSIYIYVYLKWIYVCIYICRRIYSYILNEYIKIYIYEYIRLYIYIFPFNMRIPICHAPGTRDPCVRAWSRCLDGNCHLVMSPNFCRCVLLCE